MKRLSRLTALLLAMLMIISTLPVSALASETTSQVVVDIDTWNQWVQDAKDAQEQESAEGDSTQVETETVTTTIPLTSTYSAIERTTNETSLSVYSGAETENVESASLPIAGNLILNAFDGASTYQWQVQAAGMWVSIMGDTDSSINLTYAKLQNVMENDVAYVRCVMTANGADYVSATAKVTLDPTISYTEVTSEYEVEVKSEQPVQASYASTARMASYGLTRNADAGVATAADVATTFNITVNYVFFGTDNEIAADPYTASIAQGTDFDAVVAHPVVQGYLAYIGDAETASTELVIDLDNVQASHTYTVYYKPTDVNYTVIHYQQNVDNDNYTEVERKTLTGETKSIVPETVKNSYDGFYALLFDRPAIAADGSTVVEIYYDRNYYLMTFDLDGGYGVEPIYARYGSEIGTIAVPKKAGYTFDGWEPELSYTTMPAKNTSYKATWSKADTTFIVEYYLQDPNNADKYNYFASREVEATTGDVVNGETYKDYSDIADIPLDVYEQRYAIYSKADTNVTVAGDGSTIVKVYYDRKEFTLKFYYAMSSGNTNKTYYVIGGSTYYFGQENCTITNGRDNEIKLLDQYFGSDSTITTNRGVVKSMPELNDTGDARNYTTGSDKSTTTTTSTEYEYHYISFKAKYGADLTYLWPSDVFESVETDGNTAASNWNGTTAYVSAWNGEYNVYYSQHQSNETIKGKYSKLDYQILWDYDKFGDPSDNTVTYLCFWENGADIGWSVPKLFKYSIYVPVLEGQDTTGLTTTTYNGILYYLRDQYNTVDDSNVNSQTQPALEGFTTLARDYREITNPDTTKYLAAYEMLYYYTRNQYNLTFFNGGKEDKSEDVYYEASLNECYYEPSEPENLEAGGYEFEGWYTSPNFTDGTKVDFATETMPAYPVTLYAHWVPKVYEVRFWENEAAIWDVNDDNEDLTEEEIEALADPFEIYPQAVHGKTIPEAYGDAYTAPAIEMTQSYEDGYDFIGYFYRDKNGTEKAFDINSSLVKSDMDIYAKWSSNVLKEYIVFFKYNGEDIADPIEGSALAGLVRTFDAKGGNDLYEGFREGYFPVVKSHSMTLEISTPDTVEEGWYAVLDNEGNTEKIIQSYTFEYVKADAVPYTVKYLDAVTGEAVKPEKVVNDNKKAVVTETFEIVDGMMPDAYQKRLVLTVNEDGTPNTKENVIIFYYTEDKDHAYYLITHYTEGLDGAWDVYAESTAKGDIGSVYSQNPLTITGFTYDGSVEGTLTSGTLTASGLLLKLYYKRTLYPYQVNYYKEGTTESLIESKTGEAKYDSQVTEYAADIENYVLVPNSVNPRSITIKIEDEPKLNVIDFYYREKEVDINYVAVGGGTVSPASETLKVLTGEATGSTATANEGYTFAGWFDNAECTGQGVGAELLFVPTKPGDAWEEDTFYAKFVEQEVTINYVAVGPTGENFGTVSPAEETVKVLTGVASGSVADANDPAFKFVGWFKDEACTQPVDSSWVTESTIDGAVITPKPVDHDNDATTAAVHVAATYYAKFDWYVGNLKITKANMQDGESAIFKVEVGEGNAKETYRIVLNATNTYATISGLLHDTAYTVTEESWSWSYNGKLVTGSASGNIVAGETITVGYENTKTDKWLYDEDGMHNDFESGTATSNQLTEVSRHEE